MNKSDNIKITSNIYKVSTTIYVVPWFGWRITSENITYFAVAFFPSLLVGVVTNLVADILYGVCMFISSLFLIIVIMRDRLDHYSIKEFAKIKLHHSPDILFMDEKMKGDSYYENNRKNKSAKKPKIKK